ncbi:6-phosphogluconolactonase [Microvirga yunnanensis]|uniref:6-phosphogluconolactonase n=1 Tax=Microvirga yunnanensis TaxID=2953740 RepID=UPI0021C904F3|nr:6-phosphogluconolactonase [Microvirga sp. HBU65207]
MTAFSTATVEVLADAEALARRAADWLLAAALAKQDAFTIALSGGSTPRRLYELLAAPPYYDAFPWSRTHWFWGDERFVPHDSAQSNFRMACETLLSRMPIPAANVHPVPTKGLTPEEAAVEYECTLQSFYGATVLTPKRPLFDVVLLGLGAEGHIASLFPGTAILEERRRWVASVVGAKPEPRISLTYPALNSSRQVAFLAAGESKREVLDRLFRGDTSLPAARLRPRGELRFFLDRAATPAHHP